MHMMHEMRRSHGAYANYRSLLSVLNGEILVSYTLGLRQPRAVGLRRK